jgi:hypothetical protein
MPNIFYIILLVLLLNHISFLIFHSTNRYNTFLNICKYYITLVAFVKLWLYVLQKNKELIELLQHHRLNNPIFHPNYNFDLNTTDIDTTIPEASDLNTTDIDEASDINIKQPTTPRRPPIPHKLSEYFHYLYITSPPSYNSSLVNKNTEETQVKKTNEPSPPSY